MQRSSAAGKTGSGGLGPAAGSFLPRNNPFRKGQFSWHDFTPATNGAAFMPSRIWKKEISL